MRNPGAGPAGELSCDIPVVISNHPDLEDAVKQYGVDFKCLPLKAKDAESKAAQEAQIEEIMSDLGIDLLVLARYFQNKRSHLCYKFGGTAFSAVLFYGRHRLIECSWCNFF